MKLTTKEWILLIILGILIYGMMSCKTPAIVTTPDYNIDEYPLPNDLVYHNDDLPEHDTLYLLGGHYSEIPDTSIYMEDDPRDGGFGGLPPDSNVDVDAAQLKVGSFTLDSLEFIDVWTPQLHIKKDTLFLHYPLQIHYIKIDGAMYKITIVSDTIENYKIK